MKVNTAMAPEMSRVDLRRGDRHLRTPRRRAMKTAGERAIRDRRRDAGLCPYCRGDEKPIDGIMCELCKKYYRERRNKR